MSFRSRLPQLDRSLGPVLAVTVVLFAAGSSSVAGVASIGRPGRWLGLLAFTGLVWAAVMRTPRARAAWRLPAPAAVAAALVAVALASAGWSVAPRLTVERAATLGVLLLAAVGVAELVRRRPDAAAELSLGVLAGAIAVGVAGALVAVADHGAAIQSATPASPSRYRGLGENPNTVPMLAAVALPAVRLAWWRWNPYWAACGALVLVATIMASDSRGAVVAALAAALVVVVVEPASVRRRAAAAAGVVAVMALGLALTTLAHPKAVSPAPAAAAPSGAAHPKAVSPAPAAAAPSAVVADNPSALDNEIGPNRVGQPRRLFSSSGRVTAWRGAIAQGNERALLGFGFGTEERVFVDRYAGFESKRPENSYIGMYLQLGGVGVALLLALLASTALATRRALASTNPGARQAAAVCLAVLVAAATLGIVQSYIYSVGNIATVAVWVELFAGVGLAASSVSPRRSGAVVEGVDRAVVS